MPDEFDIDVEELAGEEEGEPQAPEALVRPESEEAGPIPARAMSSRKPGQLQKLAHKVRAPLDRVKLPEWNLRTFFALLLVLLVLWFLLENWPPARVEVLIWNLDAPKTVLFLFNLILGALGLRGWQLFMAGRAARKAEREALAAAAVAAEAEGE